jgi:hypothetical protein
MHKGQLIFFVYPDPPAGGERRIGSKFAGELGAAKINLLSASWRTGVNKLIFKRF